MGVEATLHCFIYGRKPSEELEELCSKVYYYPRRTGLMSNLSPLPYTVQSRRSPLLEQNLLKDDHPILFEVLHTCGLMDDERFSKRKKIYRHSNIEHDYYRHLAEAEKNPLKKIYLKTEASKLEKFEGILNHADVILAVNELDALYFKKSYPSAKTQYIPSFHENDDVNIKPGKGDFILYHGNLSIAENYEAAEWLVKNVFSKISHPVTIAGLQPPAFLKSLVSRHSNIRLIENPEQEEMTGLIQNAHVHCLYTAQATGLKLKLLNVLFKGRFTVCNSNMTAGTGLTGNRGLSISEEFVSDLEACFKQEFTEDLAAERKEILSRFDNRRNISDLLKAVF
jgi:hypothetical protein